jgi:large subunit ribosomal protein L15
MKLHDLRPADGSRQPRTRVGRGIAAGKGKTAGRGTKGQKARAGGSIPPWFEGGQTPLHMRIPKLRGFKNRFKLEYEVVNIGAIGALADGGAFEFEGDAKKSAKSGPITVNQDILRAVGLVRTLNKPLKILGAGELSVALFVVADAFTASARAKIEAAGGSVNVLEVPTSPLAALGVTPDGETTAPRAKAKADAKADGSATQVEASGAISAEAEAETEPDEKSAPRGKAAADRPDDAPVAGPRAGRKATKGTTDGTPRAKASSRNAAATESRGDADEPSPASEAVTPSDDDA